MKKRAWWLVLALLALTPLGLISENPAWGEWDNGYYEKLLGFIPKGIENAKSIKALMPYYSVNGLGDVGGYYLSAVVGVLLLIGVYFAMVKIYGKKSI